MSTTTTLKCAGESHTGRVRTNNEDRLHFDAERGVFVVVDGVGGQAAGEVAADTAVRVLRSRLERADNKTARERVLEAIALANEEIFRLAETREEWAGMACVLTLAVVEAGTATVGHVGDTRLYKIRAGRIQKVTRDHSPVGQLEDAGELSEIEAMSHPRRNEVLRDVGSGWHAPEEEGFIDIYEVAFEPDAALLLCSDGLSDLVTSEQILRAVTQHVGNRSRTVRELIELANEAGGKDNVTVVFVEGEQFAAATRRQMLGLDEGEGEEAHAPPPPPGARPARALSAAPPAATLREETAPPAYPDAPPREGRARASAPHAGRWAFLLYGLMLGLFAPLVLWLAWYWLWPTAPAPATPAGGGAAPAHASLPAGTHFVGDPSVLAATLERARPGETVVVGGGRYEGPVRLKSGVTLVSLVPRGATIVAGADAASAVSAEDVQDARLAGFLVDGEGRLAVGISLEGSSVSVEDVEVRGTTVAGVQMIGGASRLRASYIHHNPASGVSVIDSARPDIRHNTFAANGQFDIELDPRAAPAAQIVENYFDERRRNLSPATRGQTDELMRRNYVPE